MSERARTITGGTVQSKRRLPTALECLEIERGVQDAKWGEQNHADGYWLGILAEEFGEVGKAMIEDRSEELMRFELVQVAAVAVAWIECIDRRRALEDPDPAAEATASA